MLRTGLCLYSQLYINYCRVHRIKITFKKLFQINCVLSKFGLADRLLFIYFSNFAEMTLSLVESDTVSCIMSKKKKSMENRELVKKTLCSLKCIYSDV